MFGVWNETSSETYVEPLDEWDQPKVVPGPAVKVAAGLPSDVDSSGVWTQPICRSPAALGVTDPEAAVAVVPDGALVAAIMGARL